MYTAAYSINRVTELLLCSQCVQQFITPLLMIINNCPGNPLELNVVFFMNWQVTI